MNVKIICLYRTSAFIHERATLISQTRDRPTAQHDRPIAQIRRSRVIIASHSPLNISETITVRGLVPKDHQ